MAGFAGLTQAQAIPGLATGSPTSALDNPLAGSYQNPMGNAGPQMPNQIIPDAGVYGQETAAATEAYNNAVTNALAQRNALYGQYGLLNNGSVDPNNQFGEYQQMLNSQAGQLSADESNAAGRNLGRGGLANQQVSTDRNAQGAQDFAFQNQVAGNEQNYQSAVGSALTAKNQSIAQAYQDALNTALQQAITNMESGYYTNSGTPTGGGSGGNNNKTPSSKDTSDAVSRYLINHTTPPKAKIPASKTKNQSG